MKSEVKLCALVLILMLSVIALSQSRRIDNRSSSPPAKEFEGPTITLRATKALKSGGLRLITSEFFAPEEPLMITPTHAPDYSSHLNCSNRAT